MSVHELREPEERLQASGYRLQPEPEPVPEPEPASAEPFPRSTNCSPPAARFARTPYLSLRDCLSPKLGARLFGTLRDGAPT